MAFDERFKEELKNRVDLAAIIGERITLNRKGNKYTGLCPFHNDHNPSMNVDPVRGFFKCFSCGKGGDVFTFLMDFDHLTFPESVKYLAERYGIPLPEEHERAVQRADHSLPLKDMNGYAARIFHEYLMRHKGATQARLYLKSRGIGKQTAERFQLGYSPPEWHFLEPFLRAKGFDPRLFPDTGLFSFRDGRAQDFFRGRLMFPIKNERGEVLGFGGRMLGPGEPKYLNTGETPLFRKKTILYGLHSAMKDLAKSKTIYLCEGYLDVIACQESGLPAVAPLGTALTEDQLVKLKRWGDTLVLFFDADGAGMRAAERAAVLCIEMALKAEVLTLPDGKDPFEYRSSHGPEALFQMATAPRVDVYTFLLERRIPKRLLNPAEKSALAKDFAALLLRIQDAAVMADYKNRIASALGLDASHFDHLVKAPPPKREAPPPIYDESRLAKVERDFVLMLCDNPRHIAKAAVLIRPEHLTDQSASFIYRTLLQARNRENLSFAEVLDLFPQTTARDWIERKILGSELFRSFKPPPPGEPGRVLDEKELAKEQQLRDEAEQKVETAVGDYLKKLKREILNRQKAEVDAELSSAMTQGDEALVVKWQEERLRISTELQELRG